MYRKMLDEVLKDDLYSVSILLDILEITPLGFCNRQSSQPLLYMSSELFDFHTNQRVCNNCTGIYMFQSISVELQESVCRGCHFEAHCSR